MLVATRSPIQVGVIQWPGRDGTSTIVVKRTFEMVRRGVGMPSKEQDQLGLDVSDPTGRVLFPTDFAPTKSMCDVVLIGAALLDPRGPIRLAVDPLRKLVESPSQLAARAGVGPRGDPTEPELAASWTSAAFDFEAFQSAPRDQRIPPLALPADVVFDRGAERFVTRIEGPAPEALLLDESGWSAPSPIALRADLIGIDPDRQRIVILWRGVIEVPESMSPLLVVEAGAPIRSLAPREMLQWPRSEAVDPQLLRRLAQLGAASAVRARPLEGGRGTLPLQPVPDDADDEPMVSTVTLQVDPPPAAQIGAPPAAPTFGPPPEKAHPSAVPASPEPKAAAEGLDGQGDRQPTQQMAAVDAEEIELEVEDDAPDLLTGTVALMVPPELRAPPPLPFRDEPSRTERLPRQRLETLPTDSPLAEMAAPELARASALPFAAPLETMQPPALDGDPVTLPPPPPRPQAFTLPAFDDLEEMEEEDPLVRTQWLSGSRFSAAALPFREGAAAAQARADRASLEDPPSSTGTLDLDVSGLVASWQARGLVPPAPPPGSSRGLPIIPLGLRPPPSSAAQAPVPGSATPVSEGLDRVVGLSLEQFAAIKAELWSESGDRKVALEKHGLSEVRWRLAERRFAAVLTRSGEPAKLLDVVRRLRAEVRRRPPPSGSRP